MQEAFENSQYFEVSAGKRVGIMGSDKNHHKKPKLMKQANLSTLFRLNIRTNLETDDQNSLTLDENKEFKR